MKAYVIFSSREPVLVATRQTIRSEAVLNQLGRVGIFKFIAREVPTTHLRTQYGRQFDVIEDALEKGSALRVLDFSGRRIFKNLPFSEFGSAYRHESDPVISDSSQSPLRAAFRPNPGSVPRPGFGQQAPAERPNRAFNP